MTGREIVLAIVKAGFPATRPDDLIGLHARVSVPYCGKVYDVRIVRFRTPGGVLELEAEGLPCVYSRLKYNTGELSWSLILTPGCPEVAIDEIAFYVPTTN